MRSALRAPRRCRRFRRVRQRAIGVARPALPSDAVVERLTGQLQSRIELRSQSSDELAVMWADASRMGVTGGANKAAAEPDGSALPGGSSILRNVKLRSPVADPLRARRMSRHQQRHVRFVAGSGAVPDSDVGDRRGC